MTSFRSVTSCFLSLLALICFSKSSSGQALMVSVTLDLSVQPVWNYTLFNTEPLSSGNWLTGFYLPISAPISNIQSPNDWIVDSDYSTYILWSNIEQFPYPHDIAPGSSLSGFQFESNGSPIDEVGQIGSWDHVMNIPGPDLNLSILSPSTSTLATPEPGAFALFAGVGVFSGILYLHRRRRSASESNKKLETMQ